MSKKVTHMTTEEINSERIELEPMVLLMKETNIVEHDGINYFDISKRYHELCKESVVRELLNQNKDDYSFTRVSVEERQRERSDKYDYLIGDDDDIKLNQNKDD